MVVDTERDEIVCTVWPEGHEKAAQIARYSPDGRTPLTANHNAGKLAVVDLERAEVLRTVPAGVGVETLSLY